MLNWSTQEVEKVVFEDKTQFLLNCLKIQKLSDESTYNKKSKKNKKIPQK